MNKMIKIHIAILSFGLFALGCSTTREQVLVERAVAITGIAFGKTVPAEVRNESDKTPAVMAREIARMHHNLENAFEQLLVEHPNASRSEKRTVQDLVRNQRSTSRTMDQLAELFKDQADRSDTQSKLRRLDDEMWGLLLKHPTRYSEQIRELRDTQQDLGQISPEPAPCAAPGKSSR